MSEAATLAQIRLAIGRLPFARMFRNNTGAMKDETGRLVRFGLHKGSADLIGWRTVTITPDMVGQRIAVFTSIEVKHGRGWLTDEQRTWLAHVHDAGGWAGVARDPMEAAAILRADAPQLSLAVPVQPLRREA
jgi:hypothetical protein